MRKREQIDIEHDYEDDGYEQAPEEARNSDRKFFKLKAKELIFIGAALILALALLGGNSGSSYWVTKHPMANGAVITAADLQSANLDLGTASGNYLPSSSKVIGRRVVRQMSAGELLLTRDLIWQNPGAANVSSSYLQVPVGVARSDLPYDLAPGQVVDVYVASAGNANTFAKSPTSNPSALLTGLNVAGVDSKAAAYAINTTVLLAIPRSAISYLPALLGAGRLILVRAS